MEIKGLFLSSLKEALSITAIIFLLMVIIEIFVLKYKDKILAATQKNKFMEYAISSFFGIIPGCIGTFAMDSLYMTGLIGFGGIIAVMVATSGDEAFLILSLAIKGIIPWVKIIILMLALFILGILGGYIANFYRKRTKMKFCEKCSITYHKKEEFKAGHFFKEHLYNHIIKKHIWQIFLWTFAAIFLITFFQDKININFAGISLFYALFLASLVALLPISGPNVFLVVLFSKGMIPFSILLANSIIQDGHGLLPIIGFSPKDAIKIKLFNSVFGFVIGLTLLLLGV